MKRALGVIVLAVLKARNVAFPKSGKSIFISVWLGKFFKFSKLCSALRLSCSSSDISVAAQTRSYSALRHSKKSRSSTVSYPPSNIVSYIVIKVPPKSSI